MLFFINMPSFFIVSGFCLLLYTYLMNLNHLVKLTKELLGFSTRLLWHFYINWRESGTFIVLDFFIIFFSYGFRDSLRSISSISCCLLYRPWSFKKIFLDILIFWLLWMKLFSSMKFSVNRFLESYWLLFIYFISRHFNEHSYFFLIIFWLVLAFRSLRWYPGD